MENFTFLNKALTYIPFLLLSFLVSVLCLNSSGTPFLSPPPLATVTTTPHLIFKHKRLAVVYPIIQAFKRKITEDPFSITRNWVGYDICNYKGIYCDNAPHNRSALAVAAIDFNGLLLAAPTLEGFVDKLPNLAIFHANSNKFSGSLPDFSKLPYFYELDISNNVFSGCLPYEIGNLSQATVFDVGTNKLTGPIPHSFGCLKKIELLNLSNNQFYGEVLKIVCKLSKIKNISLSKNYFTQVGPACRDLILKKKVDVRNNCILDLPSQKSKAKCASFFLKKLYCERKESFKLVHCMKGGHFSNSTGKSDQE